MLHGRKNIKLRNLFCGRIQYGKFYYLETCFRKAHIFVNRKAHIFVNEKCGVKCEHYLEYDVITLHSGRSALKTWLY